MKDLRDLRRKDLRCWRQSGRASAPRPTPPGAARPEHLSMIHQSMSLKYEPSSEPLHRTLLNLTNRSQTFRGVRVADTSACQLHRASRFGRHEASLRQLQRQVLRAPHIPQTFLNQPNRSQTFLNQPNRPKHSSNLSQPTKPFSNLSRCAGC